MTAAHLPAGVVGQFSRVVPLGRDLGRCKGHRLLLLSLECWAGWTDIRFARIDETGEFRLTRRVPPADAWHIEFDERPIEVFDAVGRGDRNFSNGEVRVLLPVDSATRMSVSVHVVPGAQPLHTVIEVNDADTRH